MSNDTITKTTGELAEDMIFEHGSIKSADDFEFVYPTGVTETRKALRNSRGLPGGKVRRVLIGWPSVPPASDADDFELVGPADGRPLVVENFRSPMGMKVVSGHVILFMQSESGNAVEVLPGARANIISLEGRKTTVMAAAGSTVHLHAFEGRVINSNHIPVNTRANVWGPREGAADITVSGAAERHR